MLLLPALTSLLLLAIGRLLYPDPRKLELRTTSLELAAWSGFGRTFRVYTLPAALMGAGYADFALIAFHLTRTGVTPPAWVPLLYALAMAVEGVAALGLGRLLDRFGILIVPVGIMFAALATPLVFLSGGLFVAIGAGLWGIGTAIQDTVFYAVLSRHVPSDHRATAYGLFDALRDTAWLAGSIVLGLVYSASLPGLVSIALVLQLGAIPVLFFDASRHSATRKA